MNDSSNELLGLLYECRSIAESAAEKIMAIYRQNDFSVKIKKDNSPVTEADFAAHHTITEGLLRLRPEIPVLSEEDAEVSFTERQKWNRYWLVDPLDGTRDFVAHSDTFSVNIALIDNQEPILGVITIPVTGESFYACTGEGAFKTAPGQNETRISTKKMTDRTPIITVSGSRKGEVLENCLSRFDKYEIKYIGSSIKSCRVAEGAVDFYPCLGPTSEWDTAAGQCIVEQAGGTMTKMDCTRLVYNTKNSLTNPWFMAVGDPDYDWSKYIPDNPG